MLFPILVCDDAGPTESMTPPKLRLIRWPLYTSHFQINIYTFSQMELIESLEEVHHPLQ